MVYNKTKRGLEKAAAIVGLVISILEIVGICASLVGIIDYAINGVYVASTYVGSVYIPGYTYREPVEYIVSQIILNVLGLGLFICALVFSSKLIKSPVNADGTINNRKKSQVCLMVFSILTLNFVSFGLELAAVCLKDFKQETTNNNIVIAPNKDNLGITIESKINELKHLKELGIIDDETYEKCITKIINDVK